MCFEGHASNFLVLLHVLSEIIWLVTVLVWGLYHAEKYSVIELCLSTKCVNSKYLNHYVVKHAAAETQQYIYMVCTKHLREL